jgi:FkbM family methyltransferase
MMIDLHNVIEKYNMNITGIIHVGGHIGQEYDEYVKINTIKHIVFFEPDPDNFPKLKAKVDHDKRCICVNRALGPFSGEATLHRENNNTGQSNSILEPHIHTQIYPGIVFNDKQKVKLEPLDRYKTSPKFNFINMDVQGAELNVLLGASETLEHIDYIITEVNRAELYKNCALVEDLDYYLGKYNFKRVEEAWDRDNPVWGDALYIKQK